MSETVKLDVVVSERYRMVPGKPNPVYSGDTYPRVPMKHLVIGMVTGMVMGEGSELVAEVHVRPIGPTSHYAGVTNYIKDPGNDLVILTTKKCLYLMDRVSALELKCPLLLKST